MQGTHTTVDVFEEGYAFSELEERRKELNERQRVLEERKKNTQKAARSVKRIVGAAADDKKTASIATGGGGDGEFKEPVGRVGRKSAGSGGADGDFDGANREEFFFDIAIDSEVVRSHLEQLKVDWQSWHEEKRVLETEKAVHMREIKRCLHEERSRFYRDLPTLHDRYLLQCMLGRGGFSEVWKALDLVEMREVAVKVHQLNEHWTEERKASYIKHVTREYTIHRDMKHPRIVQLFDVFEIDVNSFATVLDHCKGIDLDEKYAHLSLSFSFRQLNAYAARHC